MEGDVNTGNMCTIPGNKSTLPFIFEMTLRCNIVDNAQSLESKRLLCIMQAVWLDAHWYQQKGYSHRNFQQTNTHNSTQVLVTRKSVFCLFYTYIDMSSVILIPGLKCPSLRQITCASLLVHSESVIVPHVPEMKISTRPSHWQEPPTRRISPYRY